MRGFGVTRIAITVLLGFAGSALPAQAEKTLQIADGLKVTLEYTLTLPDQTVADSTAGKEPFSYIHGEHEIIPGLEKGLAGLKAGDKKRIVLTAADAYGSYDEKKKVSVPKANVPPETKVGSLLHSEEGLEARVIQVSGDSVVLDMNHPLAGKDLVFDVDILKVEKPASAK